MMEPTKEEILAELNKRGGSTSTVNRPTDIDYKKSESLNKQTIYNELKQRGLEDADIMNKLNQKPKGIDFWESMIEEVPEFAGSIAGGLIGKTPATSVIGAGVGGALGRAASETFQQIKGTEEPKSAKDIAKESIIAGAKQMGYEAGGKLLVGAAGKILAPFRKSVTPETQSVIKTIREFMPEEKSILRPVSRLTGRKMPSLLPSEITENRTLDLLHNVAESSLIGGKKIADFKVIRKQAISDMIDDMVINFGERVEPDAIGEAVVLAVDRKLKARDLITKPLYNTVEEMVNKTIKKVPVTKMVDTGFVDKAGKPLMREVTEMVEQGIISTKELKIFIQPMLKNMKEIGTIEAANAGDDLVKAIRDLPEYISFSSAKELRSRLMSKADEFAVINKKAPAIGKAKKLTELTDKAIQEGLRENNPEALEVWRAANKIYRHGEEKFNNEFIRRLIKAADDKGNPEVIAKAIFKPGAISNIRKIKTAVDDATYKKLKGWYVENLLKNSSTIEGEISGEKLNNLLFGKTGMGKQTLREIFSPAEYDNVSKVSKALDFIDKKQGEGTGRIFIQLTQAGAVMGIATGQFRNTSIAVLGGPAVLARLFTNPMAVKWLTTGAKLPANSPQVVSILGKLGGLSQKIYNDMHKERSLEITNKLYKEENEEE